MRRQAGRIERGYDVEQQRPRPELQRRDVHGQTNVIGPGRGIFAGLFQDPGADLVYEASFFSERDEHTGRDLTA